MAWLLVLIAYLVGSVQWGLIVVRITRKVDVRTIGSGKTGVTNVFRIAGRPAAVLVLAADAGKGVAAVLLARLLTSNEEVHAAVAAAAVVGHVWPVFAGFRGGRGIAPGFGTAATLDPWMALVGLAVFLPTVGITRFVSLGSVLCVIGVVLAFGVRASLDQLPMAYLWYALGTGSLIVWMHRDNVRRLLAGTERRLGRPVS